MPTPLQIESIPLTRPITTSDNAAMAAVIRTVMPEFGAVGDGYAIMDPEVDHLFETFQAPRSRFYIAELDGQVVGGGGITQLKGADEHYCELQKFYLLNSARGYGLGTNLLERCLEDAAHFGYKHVYIETLKGMDTAVALYKKRGFKPLPSAIGNTGHHGCNAWYMKTLGSYDGE